MFKSIRTQQPNDESRIPQSEFLLSDVNLKFLQSNSEFVYDAQVAIQSFLILLGTPRKSRWWRPEYGAIRLEGLLFEPFDNQTADEIMQAIQVTQEADANGNTGVVIDQLNVSLDYTTSTYRVNLRIDIPRLGLKSLPVDFGLRTLGQQ